MKKSIVVYEKGYARVSVRDQNLDMQQVAQKEVGCEKFYQEEVSGVGERTEMQSALQYFPDGDCLVVYKFDLLGRSMREFLNILSCLGKRGIGVISLKDVINALSTSGKFIMHILAAQAEFECSLIVDWTADGRAAARKAGKKFGRPKNGHIDKAAACASLYRSGMTVSLIQAQISIKSNSTIYRFLRMGGIISNRVADK